MTLHLALNLSFLSTSAPAVSFRADPSVSGRGTCDRRICTKPLAVAADAGLPMGFQSIFAWKALPEAAFVKRAVIDAHRSKHESVASGWLHRSARPILPQASPVWKVRNPPHCCLRARGSVRRASGFVQIPITLTLGTGVPSVIALAVS